MNLFTPVFQIVQNIAGVLGLIFAEKQILHASNAEANDEFGYSVGISGDGTRLIVGARTEDGPTNSTSASGAAYIYRDSNGTWVEEDILYASDAAASDTFGLDVAISEDGTRVIVGATGDSTSGAGTGAAYVFSRSGTTWTQEQKLTTPNPQKSDWFGYSVDISEDGSIVAISAHLSDEANPADPDWNSGSIHTFTRSGTTWTHAAHFWDPDGNKPDAIGEDLAMTPDGSRIITATMGSNGPTGQAYVFNRSGTTWTMAPIITASDAQSNDKFGSAVAISNDGTKLVIGARDEHGGPGDPLADAGAAYVFEEV